MSITSTYNKILQEEPVSTLIAFEKALEEEPLTDQEVRKYFNKLVDRDDYVLYNKDKIVKQIIKGRNKPIKNI